MAVTFVPATLARELAGDTDNLVSSTLVAYFLDQANDNIYAAAVQIAMTLAAHYATVTDGRVGDVQVTGNRAIVDRYMKIAANLRSQMVLQGSIAPGGFYAGGISKSDKAARTGSSDAVQPFFTRDRSLSYPRGLVADGETD